MKKLNLVLNVVVFLLFSFFSFLTILNFISESSISFSVIEHEYKIGEYLTSGAEEVEIQYLEEIQEEPKENTTYNQYSYDNVSQNSTPVKDVEPVTQTVYERPGKKGRLVIPTVNISVALYESLLYTKEDTQSIVDAYDSACYIGYPRLTAYIGDHYFQGFENIKGSVPGVTEAYIYWEDGSMSTYVCIEKHANGVNMGRIYDNNGKDLYYSGYDIAIVTCNANVPKSVTITYWNKK